MSTTFILWTCCKCNDSTQSSYLKSCCECHHHICTGCSRELHGEDVLSCDCTWNLLSPVVKASPAREDVLVKLGGADGREVLDESIPMTDIENDDGCPFQESHVAFNSMDLRATTPIPWKATEKDCSSPDSDGKMDIDEEQHATEEHLGVEKEVEIRKEAIRHEFRQIQEKFGKLARSNGFKKQQKKLSPYFEQLRDPACFAFAWERCVLPLLLEFADCWLGSTYTINVAQGLQPASRVILFMSAKELTFKRRSELQQHVLDMLPKQFHDSTSVHFSAGSVKLAFDTAETSNDNQDYFSPRNPYYYSKPTMGDSVGCPEDTEPNAGTLGPCLKIGEKGYWLINLHLIQSAFTAANELEYKLTLIHPASQDQEHCTQRPHDSIKLGVIEAVSGPDWKTTGTRMARSAETLELDLDSHHVVVDWALSTAEKPIPNLPRSQDPAAGEECRHVTSINEVVPDALIFSIGRSSGCQYGQISSCPGVVSGDLNGTGIMTREWAVQRRCSGHDLSVNDNQWAVSGIGIEGDSGASIIDSANNGLYGQVWGRNTYHGAGPRITYFTAINDVFDDIKEKYPGFTDIELPRCDGDEQFSIPACSRCYDSKQISEATRQVRSVELGQESNSEFDSPAPLQHTSDGSLTAKYGSPSNSFKFEIDDLEFEAEELSFFGTDTQREQSIPPSSTNLADDISELRSPSDTLSPHPQIQQDWLALAGIGSNDPFLGASLPMSLDDNDLFERSESGSSVGDRDKKRDVMEASKASEGKRSLTYNAVSGAIKVVKKQKT